MAVAEDLVVPGEAVYDPHPVGASTNRETARAPAAELSRWIPRHAADEETPNSGPSCPQLRAVVHATTSIDPKLRNPQPGERLHPYPFST